jgi:hypothetical protein
MKPIRGIGLVIGLFLIDATAPKAATEPTPDIVSKSVSTPPSEPVVQDSVPDTSDLEVDSDEDVSVPIRSKVNSKSKTEETEVTIRGKETEGTKAQNRFQANQVLTSRYKFNGRELEVDTD